MNNLKYTVEYFQPILDQGFRIEERQGHNTIVNYNNGVVNYKQNDEFNTIEECNKFIKEKSQIIGDSGKRKYIKFTIIGNN